MSFLPPSPETTDNPQDDGRPEDKTGALKDIHKPSDAVDFAFFMRLTDTLNTTLDLQTLLNRTAELLRTAIPYRIFAIFLLNDRTQELRMRFQIGHTPQVARTRLPLGKGVVGQVALTRQSALLNDVRTDPHYIDANPDVRSELAVPMIAKNRLIGVVDIESE
ncbi:MAG: GAF domain-containing protein, partial [Acidobacteriota bacterium]